jgi:prepilin-type N-terminal cleavage/methylation domain-containing protein
MNDSRRLGRHGFTILELVVVMSIAGLLMLVGLKPVYQATQKANARAARVAVAQNIALARSTAIARGCRATFNVDTLTGKSWVTSCQTILDSARTSLDTVGLLDNTERRFGVQIFTATPQIVYDPRGLSMSGATASYRFIGKTPSAQDSFYVDAIGKVQR